jgi:tetratricopeptide (TPR) repeat protein
LGRGRSDWSHWQGRSDHSWAGKHSEPGKYDRDRHFDGYRGDWARHGSHHDGHYDRHHHKSWISPFWPYYGYTFPRFYGGYLGLYGGYSGYYPGYDDSYYDYPAYTSLYGYSPSASYFYGSSPLVSSDLYADAPDTVSPAPQEGLASAGEGAYYDQAVAAFQRGDYREALRLAGHAAVEAPRSDQVHTLLAQAMFALKDYRGAAIAAHAAADSGGVIDWPTLYRLYGNVDTYRGQLQALEAFVRTNPSAADARFLLGYQYMILGHKARAIDELTAAVRLTPQDALARKLLGQLGVTTAEPPRSNSPQSF